MKDKQMKPLVKETAVNAEHVVFVGVDSPEVWPEFILKPFPIPVTISGMMSDSDCSLGWIRITSDLKMFTVNYSQSQASHSCIHCNLSVKCDWNDSLSFLWKCVSDIPAALLMWRFCQITGFHHHKLRAEVRNASWHKHTMTETIPNVDFKEIQWVFAAQRKMLLISGGVPFDLRACKKN